MKLATAAELIGRDRRPQGFRVSFEKLENGILSSDCFPSREETPFATQDQAWAMASLFAMFAPTEYVNIYVVNSHWVPVSLEKMMRRR